MESSVALKLKTGNVARRGKSNLRILYDLALPTPQGLPQKNVLYQEF